MTALQERVHLLEVRVERWPERYRSWPAVVKTAHG